jgi:hypothetical protein
MPSERQERYAEEVNELLSDYAGTSEYYDVRVEGILKEISRRLKNAIMSIDEQTWEAMNLREMSKQLDTILEDFANKYNSLLLASMRDGAKSGVNLVIEPVRNNLDFSLMWQEPSIFSPMFLDPTVRATWTIASSNMIGITKEVSRNIMTEIIAGISVGAPRLSIVSAIIGELDGEKLGFRTLNDRAWTIYRTETSTMFSIASELQMRQAREFIPEAQKMWHHGVYAQARKPREGHVLLDETTVPFNEAFINPLTGVSLMFPHDPAAPASEVCLCGCAHTLAMPSEDYLRNRTLINV